jgi:hypothetical protein
MDKRIQMQVDLICQHLGREYSSNIESAIDFANGTAAMEGRLHSHYHLSLLTIAILEQCSAFSKELFGKIASCSKSSDARQRADNAVLDFVTHWRNKLEQLLSPEMARSSPSEEVKAQAREKFERGVEQLQRQCMIDGFIFTDSNQEENKVLITVNSANGSIVPAPSKSMQKGGRPPAAYWDNMWVTIAVALYNGDLKPISQADVERAMTDQIEASGHSVANSTVRKRARLLWDRLSATP